jgi:antitoxin ParD1/3/4
VSTEMSAENERYLDQAVRDGLYASRDQAIDIAVELLKRRDQLRRDVQVGVEQADRGDLIPAEDVFRRLEQRAREIEAAYRRQA